MVRLLLFCPIVHFSCLVDSTDWLTNILAKLNSLVKMFLGWRASNKTLFGPNSSGVKELRKTTNVTDSQSALKISRLLWQKQNRLQSPSQFQHQSMNIMNSEESDLGPHPGQTGPDNRSVQPPPLDTSVRLWESVAVCVLMDYESGVSNSETSAQSVHMTEIIRPIMLKFHSGDNPEWCTLNGRDSWDTVICIMEPRQI